MPLVLDDDEAAGGPSLVKLPRGYDWPAHVPSTVDKVTGNPVELADARHDVAASGQECVVRPIVRDEESERHAFPLVLNERTRLPVWVQGDMCCFPSVPCQRRQLSVVAVRAGQPTRVGLNDAFAGFRVGGSRKGIPGLGEDAPDAFGDPLNLVAACRCHCDEGNADHPFRILEGISEGECAAPRYAGDVPLLNPLVAAKRLDVTDQSLCRVLTEMVQVILDGWGAFAASPLVEADSPKPGRIMSLAVAALAQGGAWAAVKVQHGHARRITRGLPVDPGVRHFYPAAASPGVFMRGP